MSAYSRAEMTMHIAPAPSAECQPPGVEHEGGLVTAAGLDHRAGSHSKIPTCDTARPSSGPQTKARPPLRTIKRDDGALVGGLAATLTAHSRPVIEQFRIGGTGVSVDAPRLVRQIGSTPKRSRALID
jgi:hypothetical protein